MTKLERLLESEERLGRRLEHVRKLAAAFGDLSDWEYLGEVVDHGEGATMGPNPPRCSCGHAIRFEFFLVHKTTGQKKPIGSECIKWLDVDAPELAALLTKALQDLDRKIREGMAAAKRAAADARANDAMKQYEELYKKAVAIYESYYQAGKKAPFELWRVLRHRYYMVLPPESCPLFKRACDREKWAKRQYGKLLAEMQVCGLA